MQYMLIAVESEAAFAARDHADEAKKNAYWGAWMAYGAALREAGVIRGGNAILPPETGTTLSVRNGKQTVEDGPFIDAKEQVGGYFIIDVPDLDTALEWAARCPSATDACVEVRPVMAMDG